MDVQCLILYRLFVKKNKQPYYNVAMAFKSCRSLKWFVLNVVCIKCGTDFSELRDDRLACFPRGVSGLLFVGTIM